MGNKNDIDSTLHIFTGKRGICLCGCNAIADYLDLSGRNVIIKGRGGCVCVGDRIVIRHPISCKPYPATFYKQIVRDMENTQTGWEATMTDSYIYSDMGNVSLRRIRCGIVPFVANITSWTASILIFGGITLVALGLPLPDILGRPYYVSCITALTVSITFNIRCKLNRF